MKPISEVYNMDCLEYMRSLPDNHFELLIAKGAVKLAQLAGRQVCADDGRLLQIETRIDNVIETRKRKLIDYLCAKVIDD